MHVLRYARVVAVGAWGRGRDRTDQNRVRHRHIHLQIEALCSDFGCGYENGIQTFDTANVSPIRLSFSVPRPHL